MLEGEKPGEGWPEALARAEARAARLLGSGATRFLVNGTSGGLHAAIYATALDGVALFPRTSHLSVYAGAIFARAKPVYVVSRYDEEWDIFAPPGAGDLSDAVGAAKPSALVVTYPDYYGLAVDIRSVCRSVAPLPVVADEAHGAHFAFCPGAPAGAIESGCAVSVQSAHKTLGALTQGSWLHVHPDAMHMLRPIDRSLDLFQTTSPSSLLLASLEASVDLLEEALSEEPPHEEAGRASARLGLGVAGTGGAWQRAVELARSVRDGVHRSTPFRALTDAEAEERFGTDLDPLRVVINVGAAGWTGLDAIRVLRTRWGIQLELGNQRSVVALISPGNTQKEADRLVAALAALARETPPRKPPAVPPPPLPHAALFPWEAWARRARPVDLRAAVGEIAAEMIVPYPPGVPVVVPGEVISPEVAAYLHGVKASGWEIRGATDPSLSTVMVIE